MKRSFHIRQLGVSLAVAAGLGLGCAALAAPATSPMSPQNALAGGLETLFGPSADGPLPAAHAAAAAYADGVYGAAYKGIGGKVPVTVTIEGSVIKSVEVGDNAETQGIGSKAIEQLPELIFAANGTEGVDAVFGASVTSKAILDGVDDCLAQAAGTTEPAATAEASPTEGAISEEDPPQATSLSTAPPLVSPWPPAM